MTKNGTIMKHTLTLLAALLLAPLAAFAQAKPEVANATTAAKRAWESAPAEKRAQWQQQRDALKHIDLSEDTQRQIIIARGSPEAGAYHAHPTTAMLADNKTILASGTSATVDTRGRWHAAMTRG